MIYILDSWRLVKTRTTINPSELSIGFGDLADLDVPLSLEDNLLAMV
jgi:hypothetical protein